MSMESVRSPMNTGRRVLSALLLLCCAGNVLSAQSAGRLEGTIRARGNERSLRTAFLEAIRLDRDSAMSFTVTLEEGGRFHVDSLPAGRYKFQLANATLDSLELALPARELKVVAGATARLEMSLPPGDVIRDAVCAGVQLAEGRGAVVGRVVNADTEEPIVNADVVVSWVELTVDAKSMRPSRQVRSGVIKTGPRGEYRLCGVPTESRLTLQLQHDNRVGGVARVTVTDDEGAVVHNLSLSLRGAALMSVIDSVEATAAAADSDVIVPSEGTAQLTGVVRDQEGHPVPDAVIRIASASPVAMSDSTGRFSLAGLPAGTQLLSVRRLGFGTSEADVELRSGRTLVRDVRLESVTSLEDIRIVAKRTRYPEFESHRHVYSNGKFLTAADIARRSSSELSGLVLALGGFSVMGFGPDAKMISGISRSKHPSCTEANVVIDGIQQAGVNNLPPSQVAGIEVYSDGVTAPMPYRSECGVIVVWSKKYLPAVARKR